MKRLLQTVAILAAIPLLTGCLLISPSHGKIVDSRSAEIPFQAWTSKMGGSLLVDCMPTNRFGPRTSYGSWRNVGSLPISNHASLDVRGAAMYSASREIQLPESCWYRNRSNSQYYTTIRVIQEDYYNEDRFEYHTLNQDGVACLGESVGRTGSWISWLSDNCQWQYTGTTTSTRYVTLQATGP